jgi:N-acetylglucosaminyl-diphospho-decaprenol L-rhamnosyltransferase
MGSRLEAVGQSAMSVHLSVVIVSYNTRDLLAQCLQSVAETVGVELRVDDSSCAEPPSRLTEVLVVDNASSDGSSEMVRDCFPWVRLIQNEQNVGFATANNQAIRKSGGRYILLLNSDARLQPHAVQRMWALVEKNGAIGVVGPTILNSDGSFQASHARFPTLRSCAVSLLGLSKLIYGPYFPSASPEVSRIPKEVGWVGGACFLVRRQAIAQVGLLDEAFFMYAEEMDWCYRMHQAGWLVYHHPGAEVIHVGGASSDPAHPNLLARRWSSLMVYWHKNHSSVSAGILRLLIAVLGLSRAIGFVFLGLVWPGERQRMLFSARANLNLALLHSHE